jgi:hypothetical protein
MQSADPATLFQTDASLARGLQRALKWKDRSSGLENGSPIWLHELRNGRATSGSNSKETFSQKNEEKEETAAGPLAPAPPQQARRSHGSARSNGKASATDADVKERALRGAATDAGRTKVLGMHVESDLGIAFVAEAGGLVRAVDVEVRKWTQGKP